MKSYKELMGESTALHSAGDYSGALELRFEALDKAEDDNDTAHTLRDIAASFDRLGNTDEALFYSEQAWATHNELLAQNRTTESLREAGASEMYVAVSAFRMFVKSRSTYMPPIILARATGSLDKITEAEELAGDSKDQYRINMIGRTAIFEGLFGERKRALMLGGKAIALALKSESPTLPTSTPDLDGKARVKAKVKAFARGAGSIAVSMLASKTNEQRQEKALQLANKLI